MLAYEFMRHAFLASGVVAVISGLVGWFLVLRGQGFAGHALSHVGFAGAAVALWAGVPPLAGMIVAAVLGGALMGDGGVAGPGRRDTVTGLVLAASLGLGLFCLQRVQAPGGVATALLFGNVLGVSRETLWVLVGLCATGVAVLSTLARPLLFASLDEEAARARGVPVGVVSGAFLVLTAVTVAVCSQVTGVLLNFSLLIGPAAAMLRLGLPPVMGLAGSALGAVGIAWLGLALSWWSDAPVSFWIGVLATAGYAAAAFWRRVIGAGATRSSL